MLINYFEDIYKKFDIGINIILEKLKSLNETTLYKDNKPEWRIFCNKTIEELKSFYEKYARYNDGKTNIDPNFTQKEQYISNIQSSIKQMNLNQSPEEMASRKTL